MREGRKPTLAIVGLVPDAIDDKCIWHERLESDDVFSPRAIDIPGERRELLRRVATDVEPTNVCRPSRRACNEVEQPIGRDEPVPSSDRVDRGLEHSRSTTPPAIGRRCRYVLSPSLDAAPPAVAVVQVGRDFDVVPKRRQLVRRRLADDQYMEVGHAIMIAVRHTLDALPSTLPGDPTIRPTDDQSAYRVCLCESDALARYRTAITNIYERSRRRHRS